MRHTILYNAKVLRIILDSRKERLRVVCPRRGTAINQVNKTLFTSASFRIASFGCKKTAEDGLDPNQWFGNVELAVANHIGQETVTYLDNIYKYCAANELMREQSIAQGERQRRDRDRVRGVQTAS